MGLFNSTTGGERDSHQLSSEVIRKLVNRNKVNTLSQEEEGLVEEALINRRMGGKISLWMIKDELTKLENKGKISRFDKEGLSHVFQDYFTEHFNKG